jgi:hypothetical protein
LEEGNHEFCDASIEALDGCKSETHANALALLKRSDSRRAALTTTEASLTVWGTDNVFDGKLSRGGRYDCQSGEDREEAHVETDRKGVRVSSVYQREWYVRLGPSLRCWKKKEREKSC